MVGVGGAGREWCRDQQPLRACIYIYTLRRVCAVTRLRYKLTYAARPMCGKERKLACRRRCQFCGAPAVVAPSVTMRAQMNPTAPRFAFVYACIDKSTYARTRGAVRGCTTVRLRAYVSCTCAQPEYRSKEQPKTPQRITPATQQCISYLVRFMS